MVIVERVQPTHRMLSVLERGDQSLLL